MEVPGRSPDHFPELLKYPFLSAANMNEMCRHVLNSNETWWVSSEDFAGLLFPMGMRQEKVMKNDFLEISQS